LHVIACTPCSTPWLTQSIDSYSGHTDVVILSVYVTQVLGSEYELWLAFGTVKQFQYLPAHEVANTIGPEKAQALAPNVKMLQLFIYI